MEPVGHGLKALHLRVKKKCFKLLTCLFQSSCHGDRKMSCWPKSGEARLVPLCVLWFQSGHLPTPTDLSVNPLKHGGLKSLQMLLIVLSFPSP